MSDDNKKTIQNPPQQAPKPEFPKMPNDRREKSETIFPRKIIR
jgi:hypothetical protein